LTHVEITIVIVNIIPICPSKKRDLILGGRVCVITNNKISQGQTQNSMQAAAFESVHIRLASRGRDSNVKKSTKMADYGLHVEPIKTGILFYPHPYIPPT
jgi:hypothetical protein